MREPHAEPFVPSLRALVAQGIVCAGLVWPLTLCVIVLIARLVQ